MIKSFNAAGDIQVLISESETDAAAPAAKRFTIKDGSAPFGYLSEERHDAPPLPLLEAESILRLFIRPDNGDGIESEIER